MYSATEEQKTYTLLVSTPLQTRTTTLLVHHSTLAIHIPVLVPILIPLWFSPWFSSWFSSPFSSQFSPPFSSPSPSPFSSSHPFSSSRPHSRPHPPFPISIPSPSPSSVPSWFSSWSSSPFLSCFPVVSAILAGQSGCIVPPILEENLDKLFRCPIVSETCKIWLFCFCLTRFQ
jgi:hypothetical protein